MRSITPVPYGGWGYSIWTATSVRISSVSIMVSNISGRAMQLSPPLNNGGWSSFSGCKQLVECNKAIHGARKTKVSAN